MNASNKKIDDVDNYRKVMGVDELQKRKITYHNLQVLATKKTRQDHSVLLKMNERMLRVIDSMITQVTPKIEKERLEKIALLASSRSQRLANSSFNLICNGYVDSAMILLRTTMENCMLIDYLNNHPDKIDDFYANKPISSKKLVSNMEGKYLELGWLWKRLCNNFVHANINSIQSVIAHSKDSKIGVVHLLPQYDKESTRWSLILIIMFRMYLAALLLDIFEEKIDDLDVLDVDMESFKKILVEMIKDLKLQDTVNKQYGDILNI